jgi:hypothetical protein
MSVEWVGFLTTSKLLVAGSIPAGVANIFNELAFALEFIPTNYSNKAVGRILTCWQSQLSRPVRDLL